MSKLKQKLKVCTLINAFALGSMYAINRTISASAILKNILKPSLGNYYNWKLGNIFYTKTGAGSPVLLIHDLNPLSSSYEWNLITEKLSKTHTVYSIDLLGCGRSDKPGITYTNYLYVQMITDFIHEIIKEKTDVAATGLSSSFVVMAAYADSDIVNKIIMINPVSLKKLCMQPDEKSKVLKIIMNIPIIGTTIYHMQTNHQNMEYVLTEKYMYNPFRIQQKYIDAYYEAAHFKNGGGRFLMASLEGFYLNADIRKALQHIPNKIAILYGNKLCNEREIALSYKKINQNTSVSAISDTKLLPQLETPEVLLNTIDYYID